MGLRTNLTRLSQPRLDALLADVAAWHELERDRERPYERENEAAGARGRCAPDYGGPADLGYGDLDKAWDALYFVLDPARRATDTRYNGAPEPTAPGGAAVWGWHPMPKVYGPLFEHHPRYNTAEETAQIAAALNATDFEAELSAHLDALAAAYVYTPWLSPPTAQGLDYLRSRFGAMRAFYAEAARHGQAVFVDLG